MTDTDTLFQLADVVAAWLPLRVWTEPRPANLAAARQLVRPLPPDTEDEALRRIGFHGTWTVRVRLCQIGDATLAENPGRWVREGMLLAGCPMADDILLGICVPLACAASRGLVEVGSDLLGRASFRLTKAGWSFIGRRIQKPPAPPNDWNAQETFGLRLRDQLRQLETDTPEPGIVPLEPLPLGEFY